METTQDPEVPRHARQFQKVACLIGLQILLSVVVLEVGGRIYADVTDQVRGAGYHEEYGWKPLPKIQKSGKGWSASVPAATDSHGWRDQEHPYEKVPGVRRIVALGDSMNFGQGIDYGDRFTEVLEELVPDLEVINLGMLAYGTDQELLVFEREGWRYHPDVVLLDVFLGNDLDDLRYERRYSWPKPYFRPQNKGYVLVPPRKTWDVTLRIWSYVAEFGFQIYERGHPSSRKATIWEENDTLPLFEWLVGQLSDRVRESGSRLLIVVIYPREELQAGRSKRNQETLTRLAESGIPTLDTFDAFRESLHRGEDLHLPDDGHWNTLGHRLAAQLILKDPRVAGWLQDGPIPTIRP